MKNFKKAIIIQASPEKVFSYMDYLSNTGMHMMQSSSMMLGSRLQLDQVSHNSTGPNSKFHWHGKVVGIKMDFTVVVTKWIANVEKSWETIGEARMIILSWYRMNLIVSPVGGNTQATLSIEYMLPHNIIMKLFAIILAPAYAKWCIKSMLLGAKSEIEKGSYVA